MKRIMALILTLLCMLTAAGCGETEPQEHAQAYFTAKILIVNENNVYVKLTDKGTSGISVGEEFYVTKNVSAQDGCPELAVGDFIKVYFNGEVMETYPLQLGKVFSIEITEGYDWGVTLTAKDVTATGLTLVCRQSEGEPTGELMTGSYYRLEKKDNGEWVSVPVIIDNVSWTDEAWLIPMNDTVEWSVNWEWLHGKLPAGEYRIGKEIMDFRKTGDYDKTMIYAEFDIIQYQIDSEEPKAFSYKEDIENYGDTDLAKHDGFVNTSAVEINDMQNAIERAKTECTVYYDMVSVSYDGTEGVWRVDFWQADTLGGGESIYLDNNGITLMVVLGE